MCECSEFGLFSGLARYHVEKKINLTNIHVVRVHHDNHVLTNDEIVQLAHG